MPQSVPGPMAAERRSVGIFLVKRAIGVPFSMPRRIESVSEVMDGSAMWTFSATYRNYHKTDVRSRIITNVEDDPGVH